MHNLIIETLRQLDSFQKLEKVKEVNLEDFRRYLNEHAREKEAVQNFSTAGRSNSEIENEIAKQVIMLGRYSKHL
jgi:hypothetical protein